MMENTRVSFEARAKEDLGGSSVACRATFRVVSHEVQMSVDPMAVVGPREMLRLVLNPHVLLGETRESYDFLIEGELGIMEQIGKALTKAAREYRALLKKKAEGA